MTKNKDEKDFLKQLEEDWTEGVEELRQDFQSASKALRSGMKRGVKAAETVYDETGKLVGHDRLMGIGIGAAKFGAWGSLAGPIGMVKMTIIGGVVGGIAGPRIKKWWQEDDKSPQDNDPEAKAEAPQETARTPKAKGPDKKGGPY